MRGKTHSVAKGALRGLKMSSQYSRGPRGVNMDKYRLVLGLCVGDLLRQMKVSQRHVIQLLPELKYIKTSQDQLINIPIFTFFASPDDFRLIEHNIATSTQFPIDTPVSLRGMRLARYSL